MLRSLPPDPEEGPENFFDRRVEQLMSFPREPI